MQRSEPIPERIGRYKVESEIGRGMMGAVYKAFDPLLERPVALKVIHLAFPVSERELESFEMRFVAEGQIVARLSHPGIVTVHDVGRDETLANPYLALEYLVGRTLDAILEGDEPLDWRASLGIVARIARALHYAHAQGVVHRDIKPANIMILEGGEPKIMDFGVAKLQAGFGLTSTGQFMGSPLYMSPEQALGQPVDARSDLFSLGSMAFTMLTGTHAFEADAVPLILNRVAYFEAPPPSQLVDGLPAALDYVLARAMVKPPESRYPEAQMLAEDLEDVLSARSPRHQQGWRAPPLTGGGTLVAHSPTGPGTRDVATRQPPPAGSADSTAASSTPARPTEPLAPPSPIADARVPARPARRRRAARPRRWPLLLATAGGLATILYASDFWQPRLEALLDSNQGRAEGERLGALVSVAADEALSQAQRAARALAGAPTPDSQGSGAIDAGSGARAPGPRAPQPRSVESAAADPTTLVGDVDVRWSSGLGVDAGSLGRLSVSLESGVQAGTVTISVDDKPAFRASLVTPAPTQRALIFRTESGGYQGTLPIATGERYVRVEITGAAPARVKTIAGTFGPGRSRHLYVVVGMSEDPLSLAWRAGARPQTVDEPER